MKYYWPFFLCALLPLGFYLVSWQEGLARVEYEKKNLVEARVRLEYTQELIKSLPLVVAQAQKEAARLKGQTMVARHLEPGLIRQDLKRLAGGSVELGASKVASVMLEGANPETEPEPPSDAPQALQGWEAVALRWEVRGPRPQVVAFLDRVLATNHYLLDQVHIDANGTGWFVVARLPGAMKYQELR